MEATHENELLTFQLLSRVNERVTKRLVKLDEKQHEGTKRETDPGDDDKRRDDEQRRYVDYRLKEIASWERRINGRN